MIEIHMVRTAKRFFAPCRLLWYVEGSYRDGGYAMKMPGRVVVVLCILLCAALCAGGPFAMSADNRSTAAPTGKTETATFGAGCFWCVEAVFESVAGVQAVVSGYTGGTVENPTYEQICTGSTGHAEACRITYDPERISYRELLEIFWQTHDPTTLNRQGPDKGTQYRSAVFYHTAEQKQRRVQQIFTENEELGFAYSAIFYYMQKFPQFRNYLFNEFFGKIKPLLDESGGEDFIENSRK